MKLQSKLQFLPMSRHETGGSRDTQIHRTKMEPVTNENTVYAQDGITDKWAIIGK